MFSVDDKQSFFIANFEHGLQHGLTKYYSNKRLILELEYENGELTGKTITYFRNGNPFCEGYTKNGRYHGPCRFYDSKKNILFETTCEEGIVYDPRIPPKNELRFGREYPFAYFGVHPEYEGYFKNNQRHGAGKLYSWFVPTHKGLLQKFLKFHLFQKEIEPALIYEGEFFHGDKHGMGKLYEECGDLIYEGNFKNNMYHGFGKLYSMKKLVYEGQFFENNYHGSGKWFGEFGWELVYDGEFEHHHYHGFGKLFHSNGLLKYEGSFKMNAMHGSGKLYNFGGELEYEGEFIEDKKHGMGTLYRYDGKIEYEGEFFEDKKHGMGTLYRYDGELEYKGEFYEDKPNSENRTE